MLRIAAPVAFALTAFSSVPASAEWQRASSAHFVIYANEAPAKLKAFAEKLERFDKAVRVTRSMKDPPVGDGNRLTVFVVSGPVEVQKLHPGIDNRVAGFYRSRATGSVAVVPRTLSRGSIETPDTVFFHEYAHHLMFQDISTPYPPWLVEGFAEFLGTAEIGADGSVGLGGAPVHRAPTLYARTNPLPFSSMLGAAVPRSGPERGALYARGWLLTHYLTFAPKRRGQLDAYLSGMAAGRAPLDSAKAAFGDLGELERDTEVYLRANKFAFLSLPATSLPIGAVTVEPLSPGMSALMPLYMRQKSGTESGAPASLAARIRAAAAAFPADPMVQAVLAEAELDAGDAAAAEAAADRAIAARPAMIDGLILKGRAVLARASARQAGATFVDARRWFMAANKIDPEDPEPLILFFQSYRSEKVRPTANASAALHYAADLAPHDSALRLANARLYLVERKPAEARRVLVQLAYNPHGGSLAEEAGRLIGLIDSGQIKAALEPPARK